MLWTLVLLPALASISLGSSWQSAANAESPAEHVNTRGGTNSRFDLSHGNLLPLVTVPWGFNAWAPVTDNDPQWSQWWFHPSDRRFFGIRCTHQPSPWIGDYGYFLISAAIVDESHDNSQQYSIYNPDASAFKPYLFNATLLSYGTRTGSTRVEVTSSSRAAVLRFSFPRQEVGSSFNQTQRVLIKLNDVLGDDVEVSTDAKGRVLLTGWTSANNGGVPRLHVENQTLQYFKMYFAATLVGGEDEKTVVTPFATRIVRDVKAADIHAALYFTAGNVSAPATSTLVMRVATSLISPEQALLNLQQEIGDKTFDDVMKESKLLWDNGLGRVKINSVSSHSPALRSQESDMMQVFYSSMYRAMIFPRDTYEVNASGHNIHYSPYDLAGRTFDGVSVSDSGFWDAYRTVYPALSLLFPTRLGLVDDGWLSAYKEGGWLPNWASPGYRGSMVGTMGDAALADAIVKDIAGFDRELAYAAIRQDAFVIPPTVHGDDMLFGVGRAGLESYLKYSYIPYGAKGTTGTVSETVSRTLNYVLSDYAIAQAAQKLGKQDDYDELMNRSTWYKHLFDAESGFFRAKTQDGSFIDGFDEFAWGDPYTEGGPWQYRFYVPHDPAGLASLYDTHVARGGQSVCDTLEAAQDMAGLFHVGAYGTEIHEMTEMALLCWGQYEHNNQPVHHMLYMFVAVDAQGVNGTCARRGQKWLRQAMLELYRPGDDMFCGDEDNGEFGAWYVLSALGLYQLAPGDMEMIVGAPLFADVEVTLEGASEPLHVVAKNNSPGAVYVASVTWRGKPLTRPFLRYDDVIKGGLLEFEMTA